MVNPSGIVALLTDVGRRDPYVGSIRGSVLKACMEAKLVDITHEVPSFNIREASFTLLLTYRFFPPGTVFVVIVVPGVGVSERPVLIVTKNYFFIGPDNGVLAPAAEGDGIEDVISLRSNELFAEKTLETFHGRDIYAPAAALIACGVAPKSLGYSVTPSSFKKLHAESASNSNTGLSGCIELAVKHVDKYGNLMFARDFKTLLKDLKAEVGATISVFSGTKVFRAVIAVSFSDVSKGTLIIYGNSFGITELAINQGSAKELLNAVVSSKVKLCTHHIKVEGKVRERI